MSFVLYWFPFSGSLAPMAVLEEAGVSYEKTLIDISKGEHLSPEYLEIHPLGLVPAFRLENGKYIFESAGICMYLADLFPEYKLAPPFDDPGRGVYNQWMLFLASSIYPVYGRIAHPEWYSVEPSHRSEIKVAAISQQRNQWMVVEKALENRSWLLGEKFSTADIYLLMLSTWDEDEEEFARFFPNVTRVAASAAKRPAVQRAMHLHTV
jgi:glutathione S-transferase